MINYLIGSIKEVFRNYIVLEVKGFGLKIYHTNPLFFELNKEYKIITYLFIKEDDVGLYGFKDKEERQLFEELLTVNGIGPKTAFAILSNEPYNNVICAINKSDDNYLRKIAGIGSKNAMQIIITLKDKVRCSSNQNYELINKLTTALKSLNFKKQEIDFAIKNIDLKSNDLNECIKQALLVLGKDYGRN